MFYITVVVYNKSIKNIASLGTLNQLLEEKGPENINIIVVDNSDSFYIKKHDESISRNVSKNSFAYLRSGENLGLSKAYNKAIEHATALSKDTSRDFMLLLDDDTDIPYSYIHKIYDEYNVKKDTTDGINIITGFVTSEGKPLSPVKSFRLKFRDKDYIKEAKVYDDILCINSGMAIRLSILEKVGGFDESLFLDMIDFAMMHELSRRNLCKVLVVEETIDQSFSGRIPSDKRALLNRFQIYKKDFIRYSELTGKGRFYGKVGAFKRRIAIEFKSGGSSE